MKFLYIKHYGARVGDDFSQTNNKLEHIQSIVIINRRVDAWSS